MPALRKNLGSPCVGQNCASLLPVGPIGRRVSKLSHVVPFVSFSQRSLRIVFLVLFRVAVPGGEFCVVSPPSLRVMYSIYHSVSCRVFGWYLREMEPRVASSCHVSLCCVSMSCVAAPCLVLRLLLVPCVLFAACLPDTFSVNVLLAQRFALALAFFSAVF